MFTNLITFITSILLAERQLEGYNQVVLAWSGQKDRADSKGHVRTTTRRSPLDYILRNPQLRIELAAAFAKVHGISADFQSTCDEFYTSSKTLTGKALQNAKRIQTAATEKLELALARGIVLDPSVGWTFLPSRSGRMMAAFPSAGGSDDPNDEFLRLVGDLTQKS